MFNYNDFTYIAYRAEKEYASLSKQLNHELEEKRKVIKDLSRQLEAHQKDFNDLKHELNKVCWSGLSNRRRLVYD